MGRETLARGLAAAGAALGVAALALQFQLTLRLIEGSGGSTALAIWRYVGYFTILTNMFAVLTLAHAAWRPQARSGLGAPRVELAAATAMAMVGLVYSWLLRATWNPQGAQKVADALLHDVMPIWVVAWFLLRRRARLGFLDAPFALIFPLGYVVYALVRGEADGWYAYWFLDRSQLSAGQMALNALGLAAGFLVMAGALSGLANIFSAARAP